MGVVLCSGCGGNSGSTADPGTDGELDNVQIQPAPGSTFIPQNTRFLLSWTTEKPPPRSFTVALRRYREARGEEPREVETQRTELNRQGDSFVWELRRRDSFELDAGGVYYLELVGGGQFIYATYIVSDDRSISPRSQAQGTTGTEEGTHTVTLP
jgi:hypothetical protein